MTASTDPGADAQVLPQPPHIPAHRRAEPDITPRPRTPAAFLSGDRGRILLRLLIAVGVSAVVCQILRKYFGPSLASSYDIVGYPTYANYNFEQPFWTYHLLVYALPALAIVLYAALWRFGPLRSRVPAPAKRTIELVEPAVDPLADPAGAPGWGVLPRLLLPTALVVVVAGERTGHTGLLAVACGLAYLVVVLGAALLWGRREGRPWQRLSLVNGVAAAVAAVLGLWFVSAHTVVHSDRGDRFFPWFAWWLAAAAVVAIGWWAWRQVRAGRSGRDIERTLLTVIVGAVALFLAVSVLPDQVTHYAGYDDGLEMAGANMLSHGYFPWRDTIYVHGLFPDALTGTLGRAVFGDTVWSIWAMHSVILVPLCWVNIYLFATWVSRRNPWVLTLVFLGAASGLLNLIVAERFIAVPLTFIVLGEAVRRRSGPWVAGLTLMLFVQAVMVPETSFLTIAVLATLLAFDFMHRRPDQSLWRNLRMTRWCAATGVVALAVFAAFMAAYGAVQAFIDYYIVVGPGHNVSGAIPPTGIRTLEWGMFIAPIVAVLISIWAIAVRVARRADFEARDWVVVGAGFFVALYMEKALARFDFPHVWQVFGTSLPLILLWVGRILDGADRPVVRWFGRLRSAPATTAVGSEATTAVGTPVRSPWLLHPVSAVVMGAFAVALVIAGPLPELARKVDQQHTLAGAIVSDVPRVGFATPTGIDTALLADLNTTLDAYAGDTGPIFDMTNSLGYFFYLLDREPGMRFVHVSMSVPPYAQKLNIDELAATRPAVVIYDAKTIGLPVWDQLSINIRHYQVSEYVLNHWTPVYRTHGVLVLVRNDLVGSRPMPTLTAAPQTDDLYFGGPECAWGAVPNFLPSPAGEQALTLPVAGAGPRLVVDYTGWAVDPATKLPAQQVLVADGDEVVGTVTPSIDRPDVATSLGQTGSASGFHYNALLAPDAHPAVYVLGSDGRAHPIGGAATGTASALRMADGSHVPVAANSTGNLDGAVAAVNTVGQIQLPAGVSLRRYSLATLSANGSFGGSAVAITDQPGRAYHDMSAVWLPQSGSSLTLRAGSCPQWYGYDASKPLYVVQNGGPAVTSVTLSVVPS